MSQTANGQHAVRWLLKPWNAAFCLWAVVWGGIGLAGTMDYMRPQHADALWEVGWAYTNLIAGLPLSLALMPALEYTAPFQPLTAFLVVWAVCAVASFFFWLVLIPLAYRWLITAGS